MLSQDSQDKIEAEVLENLRKEGLTPSAIRSVAWAIFYLAYAVNKWVDVNKWGDFRTRGGF